VGYISKEEIFKATNNGLDIIKSYYPDADETKPNKKFKARDEADASANLVFKDIWFVKDHGSSDKAKNAIQLVMDEEHLDFKEALNFIAESFNLSSDGTTFSKSLPKPVFTDYKKPQDEYTWEIKDFSESDLAVLGPKVTQELCQELRLYCIKSYINKKGMKFESTQEYPIYIWDFETWQKLYQPMAKKEFRFMYFGKKPKNYTYGLERCKRKFVELEEARQDAISNLSQGVDDLDPNEFPETIDHIIKASGDRDALNIAAGGYQVVWTDSEAVMLSRGQYKEISKLCDEFHNLPDIDSAGIKYAQQLALKFVDMGTIYLPDDLRKFKDHRGNECKDFTDFVKKYNNPYIFFKKLVKTSTPLRFWDEAFNTKTGKSEVIFRNSRFYNFLKASGFYRYESKNEKEGFIYIYVKGNVVKRVLPVEMRTFVNNYLKSNYYAESIRDSVYRSNQTKENSLSQLDQTELDFKTYDKSYQYLFFNNISWKITKDGIEEIKNTEIKKHIWEDKLHDHRVKKLDPFFEVKYSEHYVNLLKAYEDATDKEDKKNIKEEIDSLEDIDLFTIKVRDKEFSFIKFLINTSAMFWQKIEMGEELTEKEKKIQDLHLINKLYSIGYLLHQYKDPSKAWAVFAMDARNSELGRHEGGSGKSIVYKAVRNLLKSVTLKGQDSKITLKDHLYENVTRDTDYILIDDCSPYLDFHFFFSEITGELTVNPKHAKQYELPYDEVPKFAFTSNNALKKVDGSTLRRILYTAFSDYYHKKDQEGRYKKEVSPYLEIGKNLFDDYNEDEWNQAFNLFANCISLFLRLEKVEPPMQEVEKRNLRIELGETFLHWAEEYFEAEDHIETFIIKNELYETFKEEVNWKEDLTSFDKRKYRKTNFKKLLSAFARYAGYELNPQDVDGYDDKSKRILKHDPVDQKIKEYLYMRKNTNIIKAPKDDLPF
jgi:hypothetical protein